MYSILLSAAIAVVFSVGGFLLDWWHWGWCLVFGPVVFLGSFILIARRVAKRLQGPMSQLKTLMEQQRFDLAMQALKDVLPLSSWMPMLRGQLSAQMGVLCYQKGDMDQALKYFGEASPRAGEAKVLEAAILYKRGDKDQAYKVLTLAGRFNKKTPLLHNMHAWLLNKDGRIDDAIAVLAASTKKNATDEIGKNNLLRLQNKNKMSMKDFGMFWYALGFERPPRDMGELRQGRKGFRQPKMRKGG